MRIITVCVVVMLALISAGYASQPSSDSRNWLETQFAIEEPRGGDTLGYGRSRKLSVTGTAAGISTADVSSDGVMSMFFMNTGASDVFLTLSATTPSTATANIIIPPGASFSSRTKSMVTTIQYYCPTGTATLYVAY